MPSVLITGANRGIGLALVGQFLEASYEVIATCRNPQDAAQLQALNNAGTLDIHPLEITSEGAVQRLASALAARELDILIHCAGTMGDDHQSATDMDYELWLTNFSINTLGPYRLTVALLDQLRRSSRPRVITLSSQLGAMSWEGTGHVAYQSSKAAVNKVMRVLSLELADEGIIVCPVHPGWVRTDMGGKGADLAPSESAAGLFALIESLKMEHSGRFWTWDGREHAW